MNNNESSDSRNKNTQTNKLPIFLVNGLEKTIRNSWWRDLANKHNIPLILLYGHRTKDGDVIGIEIKVPSTIRESEFSRLFLSSKIEPTVKKEDWTFQPDSVISVEDLMGLLNDSNEKNQKGMNIAIVLDDSLLNKKIKDLGTCETLTIDSNVDDVEFLFTNERKSPVDDITNDTIPYEFRLVNSEYKSEPAQPITMEKMEEQLTKMEEQLTKMEEQLTKHLEKITTVFVNGNKEEGAPDDEKTPIGETGLYVWNSNVYNEDGEMALESGSAKHILFMSLFVLIGTNKGLDKKELMDVLNASGKKYKEDVVVTLISRTNKTLYINTKRKYRHLIKKMPKTRGQDKAKYYIDC